MSRRTLHGLTAAACTALLAGTLGLDAAISEASASPPGSASASATPAAPSARSTVGIEGRLIYRAPLAGLRVAPAVAASLEALPVTEPAPASPPAAARPTLSLRINSVTPDGPTAFLYDLRFVSALPGQINLAEHLELADGTPAPGLPPALVAVTATLPEDADLLLSQASLPAARGLGGYRTALLIGGVLWLAPLGWLLARRLLRTSPSPTPPPAPPTLADRLRPLIARVLTGDSSPDLRASMEHLLLLHFQAGARATGPAPSTPLARARLRDDPLAAPTLRALEAWFHDRPADPALAQAHAERLLATIATAPTVAHPAGGAA